jgi:uncharacterized protein YecE (DUF72 family)
MTETLLGLPFGATPAAMPPVVTVANCDVRFGTSSWADRSLVRDGGFYPRKTLSASARLAYYCSQLGVAEIATTYRFPPTPDLARQWAERTPAGFRFDVRAWSLLTGAPTLPDSLWEDLQTYVRPELRHRRRLYADHLTEAAVEECWARFAHALRPLQDAGRLGVVVLQYPTWFTPKVEHRLELAAARARLADFDVAVELRSPRWFEGGACEDTLEWLEGNRLAFVCTDGPSDGPRATPGVVAATADVAIVRFEGRRHQGGEPWTFPYRYSEAELAEWVPRIAELAGSAREVHVVMDNTWRGDAVDNARALARLLADPAVGGVRVAPPRP